MSELWVGQRRRTLLTSTFPFAPIYTFIKAEIYKAPRNEYGGPVACLWITYMLRLWRLQLGWQLELRTKAEYGIYPRAHVQWHRKLKIEEPSA